MYLGKGKNKRKVFDDKINNPVSIRIIGKWKEEEKEEEEKGEELPSTPPLHGKGHSTPEKRIAATAFFSRISCFFFSFSHSRVVWLLFSFECIFHGV